MTLMSLSQVMFLRKSYGSRLNVFAPVNDLSSLSKTGSEGRAMVPGKRNDVAISGGQILGDEYSTHVVKVSYPSELCWAVTLRSSRIAVVSYFVKGTSGC